MASLGTRDKRHYLLPRTAVLADLFTVYIRLERLVSRLVKLRAHRLYPDKTAHLARCGGYSLIITYYAVYTALNRRDL